MEANEYLFVNEDPDPTVQKPSRRSVNRHAQRFSIASRRPQLKPSCAPRGWLPGEADPIAKGTEQGSTVGKIADSTSSSSINTPQQGRFRTTSSGSKGASQTSSTAYDLEQDVPRIAQGKCPIRYAQCGLPAPFAIAPQQVLDPFQTTSIPVQSWTYIVIDYYARCWVSPPSATGAHYLRRNALFRNAVGERVRSCLSNEVHMYSLAAAVAAHMRFVRCNRALDQCGPDISMEWFLHRALRALRQYFSSLKENDEIDPQALIDIQDLFKASYYSQSDGAARAHSRIFDKLVEWTRSKDLRDLHSRDFWNFCAVIKATKKDDSKLLPAVFSSEPANDIFQGHSDVQNQLRVSPELTGSAFEHVLGSLSVELAILTKNVVRWADRVNQLIWRPGSPQLNAKASYLQAENLLASILWVPTPTPTVLVRESSVHVNLSVHDARVPCVRMALVLWLMHAMSHPAKAEATSHLLPRLQDTFSSVVNEAEQEPDEMSVPQQRLFVWVASVGILAAEQMEPYRQWFTKILLDMCPAWQIENGVQLLDAIKQLLYIDTVQGDSLKRLAEKLDARHSSDHMK